MHRTEPSGSAAVLPIPGDEPLPYLAHVASTYASRGDYEIHRCRRSGLGVTVPFPTPDELDAMYASTYDYGAHSLIQEEKRWRARTLIEKALSERASPVSSALDVGCMYGYLLEELSKRGVRKLSGIELSAEPAGVARAKGFAVYQGTMEQYAASGEAGKFEIIFAQHVLEHLRDPARFLQCAFNLLTPGGKLVLAVPHFGSLTQKLCGASWGWYQVPAHLFHFSKDALAILCRNAGFCDIETSVRGGDSLFMLMTMHHLVAGKGESSSGPLSPMRKRIIRAASWLLRPYLHVGDEELVMVASKPG